MEFANLIGILLHISRLSGAADPLYGEQTFLEKVLNEGNADWEITTYSDIGHRFTYWPDPRVYRVVPDVRSWNSMKEVFGELLGSPSHNIFA